MSPLPNLGVFAKQQLLPNSLTIASLAFYLLADQRAFLITLTRAGEDNATFKVRDLESTFAGFAGADYVLQDAIQSATNTTNSTRELDGIPVSNAGFKRRYCS